MSALSLPALPDCAVCGSPVVLDVDHDGDAREVCIGCGLAQKPMPPRLDRTEIRQTVKASRPRRLLGPSCFGRRHHQCKASGCTCLCHDKEVSRGAQA